MAIRIDKQEQFSEVPDVTVWGDDKRHDTYYALPQSPRYRLGEDGLPVFKFIKYRLPVDRPDGNKGGGYVFFDAELAVSDEKMGKLQELIDERIAARHRRLGKSGEPPKGRMGTITYVRGEVSLLLEENGVLIEKITSAGVPSLYGNNVASFAVELSPEGAAVFEGAMQGDGASMVAVVYRLWFIVKLPPLKAHVWFNSTAFYSFTQEIDTDWNLWREDSYQETIKEEFYESQSGGTQIDFDFVLPDPQQDEELKNRIRDWASSTLENMVEQAMIESIAPFPEDKRDKPDGIEDVTRDISTTKTKSFSQTFKENSAAEWNLNPQGNLGTIVSMVGPDGQQLRWEDYSVTIDADDPFFKQLNVNMMANADFERLGIFSIEVKINYPGTEPKEFRFTKSDDVHRFSAYLENDNWEYVYSYQVNYKGESRIFQSEEIETDEKELTINVDDVGVLIVDVEPGDLNFAQVSQVQVAMQYEDSGAGVDLLERQFTINEQNTDHRFQENIFAPTRKPYRYKTKYFMADGKEFELDFRDGISDRLYINDPFGETRTVGIRAIGNLDEIQTIFVDLKYIDEGNDYSQTHSVALSKTNPFVDWSFSVIDPSVTRVVYSGTVQMQDGTVEEIPETETTEDTILVGKRVEDVLEVTVLADLLDMSLIRLAKVSLRYDDEEGDVHEKGDFVFRPGGSTMETWTVELKNKDLQDYQWKADYFLTDGSRRMGEFATTGELTLVLELPA